MRQTKPMPAYHNRFQKSKARFGDLAVLKFHLP